jgi:hypothetical protein
MVKLRDVSRSGIGLILNCRPPVASTLVIKLQTPTQHLSRPMLLRVEHVTDQGDGTWVVGCSFVRKLREEELEALR